MKTLRQIKQYIRAEVTELEMKKLSRMQFKDKDWKICC